MELPPEMSSDSAILIYSERKVKKKKKHKIRTEHTPFSKVILLPKMSFYSTMLIDERVRFK